MKIFSVLILDFNQLRIGDINLRNDVDSFEERVFLYSDTGFEGPWFECAQPARCVSNPGWDVTELIITDTPG